MARKDYDRYIQDLNKAGISDAAVVNQYVKALEAGIVIPRHIMDVDTIRSVRDIAKKLGCTDFNTSTVDELIYAVQVGMPQKYIISGLTVEQMCEIRAGYVDGVDVEVYLDRKNPPYLMFGARKMLKNGISKAVVKQYINIIIKNIEERNYDERRFEEVVRWYLEDGGDIDKALSAANGPSPCKRLITMREELNKK